MPRGIQTDRSSTHLDLLSTVGRTPLVELRQRGRALEGRLFAKLEMRNPAGSVKDRLAIALVDDAERRGALNPAATIVAATGGNTGIGLAFVAAVRGYPIVLTMPESMSRERVALLEQLGAEVELTSGILMADAVALAQRRAEQLRGAVLLDQFTNPVNPEVHRQTTGVEIWEQTGGRVDAFVAAVGTGGTITGVGEVLKQHKPPVRVVAVEPERAAVLSGRPAREHRIPGIGVGFIPPVLNRSILDEVIAVSDDDAFAAARRLAREEGIIAGASSGAAVHAAQAIAMRVEARDSVIVVLLADTGERYVTTELFDSPRARPVSASPRE